MKRDPALRQAAERTLKSLAPILAKYAVHGPQKNLAVGPVVSLAELDEARGALMDLAKELDRRR